MNLQFIAQGVEYVAFAQRPIGVQMVCQLPKDSGRPRYLQQFSTKDRVVVKICKLPTLRPQRRVGSVGVNWDELGCAMCMDG